MTATARQRTRPSVTIEAFDALLDAQRGDDDCRYELIDGEIVLMTNPSNRHEDIVRNMSIRLETAMDRRGCQTYRGGTYVEIRDDVGNTHKLRPDLMVRCGETRADPGKNFITDPVVLIEVLSPSAEQMDLVTKVPLYMAVPSSRHIVIVAQDERRIEHWARPDAEAAWERRPLPRDGEVLTLAAVAFEITLDEVYDQIPLGRL